MGSVVCNEYAPSTISLIKCSGETPLVSLQATKIAEFYLQEISWRSVLHCNGARQVVDLGQIYMLDVIAGIVVLDLTARPINALDTKDLCIKKQLAHEYYSANKVEKVAAYLAFLDRSHRRNVRMPSIVQRSFLLPRFLLWIDREESWGHDDKNDAMGYSKMLSGIQKSEVSQKKETVPLSEFASHQNLGSCR